MSLAAGTRLGVYEVISPLGAGGMGEVYRARDPRLSREVALKILPAEVVSDASRLKRFEKEARAASALNHPNIVTIYDIGQTDGVSWISMEKVEGKTLREALFGGALPIRKLLPIGAQIADGLARAHEAGIVHRDLKPENVMVTKDGLVKVLDFGLAKQTGPVSGSGEGSHLPTETGTSPGVVLGTVGYMSPEQAGGQPLDFRSDQFSFGSILYELATGKRAFQKGTAVDTLSAILHDEPKPIGEISPDTPALLRWIVERCLAKDPEGRYASTKDLARDLTSLRDRISEVRSGAEAVLGTKGRPRRRITRLAAVAALVAGLIAAVWAATRAESSGPPPAPSFKRLTFRQGEIGSARFAPDGRTVVYSANWERDSEGPQLYQTVVGSPESRPFEFRGDVLAISPSNELAIVQQSSTLARLPQPMTLARVPMSGGTPRQVMETVDSADFSPDGRELVISQGFDGKRRLEFPPGNVIVSDDAHSPRFSPDGNTIVFWDHASPDQPSLTLVDRLGKSRKSLTNDSGHSGGPCWKPDGREIWFTARSPGEREALWAVDLSGRRRLIMRVPGGLELNDISKDGKVLLAHHTMTRTVRSGSAAGTRERDLSWLDSSVAADLSADGKTLLFTEDGEGSGGEPTVYVRGTDGSPAAKYGKGVACALSPDGKWVLASTPPNAKGEITGLLLLPTGPGEERALDRGGLAGFLGGGWLPDSRSVVFSAAPAGGKMRIWLQALPEGKPRPISPEGFRIQPYSNPVSPDGRFVVGVHYGGRGEDAVLLFPLDGAGQPRTVSGLGKGDWVHQWTSDMRGLYVSNFPSQWPPIKVWLFDFETGQRRLWKQIETEKAYGVGYFLVTPDGKTWVYSGGHLTSELYVVEGLR